MTVILNQGLKIKIAVRIIYNMSGSIGHEFPSFTEKLFIGKTIQFGRFPVKVWLFMTIDL